MTRVVLNGKRLMAGDRVEYSDLSPWEKATVVGDCDPGPARSDTEGCDLVLLFDGDPVPLAVPSGNGLRRPRGGRR